MARIVGWTATAIERKSQHNVTRRLGSNVDVTAANPVLKSGRLAILLPHPQSFTLTFMMKSSPWMKIAKWQRTSQVQSYAPISKTESDSYEEPDQTSLADVLLKNRRWVLVIIVAAVAIAGTLYASLQLLAKPALPAWFSIYPSYVENEPKLLVEWNADPRFSRSSPDSKAAWDDLLPAGHGHILVSDAEQAQYGLGRGKSIPDKGFAYAVSGFHQLHCLAMIREALFRMMERPEISLYSFGDPANPALNLTAHLDHCFDYLRQGIMCAADSTIESKHEKPGHVPGPEDEGWGNVHICRSWNALKEFAGSDQRRPGDWQGLSIDHYFQQGHSHDES